MDDLAFQLAGRFSNGLAADLESAFKEIEAEEASRPFHADKLQRGSWVGAVEAPKGKVHVRIQITNDDQMQIGFEHGAMLPVADLGIEEGFLSGEAATRIRLPETANQPAKLTLQLLWFDGSHLMGPVRTESTTELPHFGLPLSIPLPHQH